MTAAPSDPEFEQLLAFVRDARSFDYTGYKRPTLERRVRKRMEAVGSPSYADYREYLERDPHEFEELFDTILINVTSFFATRQPGSASPKRSGPPARRPAPRPTRSRCCSPRPSASCGSASG